MIKETTPIYCSRCILILGFIMLMNSLSFAQENKDSINVDELSFFANSPRYDKKRFTYAASFAGTAYVAFSYGFYNSWYKNYPQSEFHFFNDNGEWNQMDKAGHIFSGYFQSMFCYNGAKWTGLDENKSIWIGIGAGALFQSTIEVMDGFSEEWGFSVGDVVGNTVGLGTFYLQQKKWGYQRITLKESAWPRNYPETKIMSIDGKASTTQRVRALDLYGSSWGERMLKDYNVQTYWASIQMKQFFPNSKWPSWLNLAVGYGADQMYGGYTNEWTSNGSKFDYSGQKRQRQLYLALDYDLRAISSKSHTLKAILNTLNIYKFPAPAIEYNNIEGWKFHLLLH
jgi:hypothetical protein